MEVKPFSTEGVAAGIAYGYYLSLLSGKPDTSLQRKAKGLYATYDDDVNEWTRPAGPPTAFPHGANTIGNTGRPADFHGRTAKRGALW